MFLENLDHYIPYNGFYKRREARQKLFEVFGGKCSANGQKLKINRADLGHIVPQSESIFFEELFPGLDVHNVINLTLLSADFNRKVSNAFPKSPHAIFFAISYNIRILEPRLKSLLIPTKFFLRQPSKKMVLLGEAGETQQVALKILEDLKSAPQVKYSIKRNILANDPTVHIRFFPDFDPEALYKLFNDMPSRSSLVVGGEVKNPWGVGLSEICGPVRLTKAIEDGFAVSEKVLEIIKRRLRELCKKEAKPLENYKQGMSLG